MPEQSAVHPAGPWTGINRRRQAIACAAFVLFLVVNIPLFIAQPLTADAVLFDLEVRNVLSGGIAYRDIFQTNPPGTLWLHMAVRSLFGWSSEALRIVDLLIVSAIIGFCLGWLRTAGRSATYRIWAGLVLYGFYFSLTTWCHCQRDMWMLGFAMAALALRVRQIDRIEEATGWTALAMWAILEGMLWAGGFWIKPFVVIPGAAVILLGTCGARRLWISLVDLGGVLLGGLLVGAAGSAWMWSTGAMTWFWSTLSDWNIDYLKARRHVWTVNYFAALAGYFAPWMMAHLLAIVYSLARLLRWWSRGRRGKGEYTKRELRLTLLAVLYLGWFFQAFALQHWHAYVHAPAVLLALVITATESSLDKARMWKPLLLVFFVAAAAMSPLTRPARIGEWWACVTGRVTPQVRDRVRGPLAKVYPAAPDCVDLASVADFLRTKHLRDGELMCYSYSTMYLYRDLDLKPPCRFVCPRIYALLFFVDRHREIHDMVAESPQRYVVTDLLMTGLDYERAVEIGPDGPLAPPPIYPEDLHDLYPWSHPIVFRAGRYLVHELRGPMGRFGKLPVN